MFYFYWNMKQDIKEHYPNWSEIHDRPYRVLIVGYSGSGSCFAVLQNGRLNSTHYLDPQW